MRLRSLSFALLFLTLALLLAFPTANAQDQGGHDPLTRVEIKFGSTIQFFVQLESESDLLRAVLFIRTTQAAPFKAYLAQINAVEPGAVNLSFDPKSLGLRPFGQIEYYWQIDLADGTSFTTEHHDVIYLDRQYDWQSLSDDQMVLHWVDGDITWGQDLLGIAIQALQSNGPLLAPTGTSAIHIYVYPDQSSLQNSLRLAGINQASAHALPEAHVVLVAGKNDPETLIRMEQDIPHELVHVLLYERLGSAMENIPTWLNEGLATLSEQSPRLLYTNALERAADDGSLLQIESLCSGFPIGEGDRILAYAQSASFTNYLLDVYGTGGILQLLDAYHEGATCTGGIQRVYQRSLGQLQSEWKSSEFVASPIAPVIRMIILTVSGGTLILALIILVKYISRRFHGSRER